MIGQIKNTKKIKIVKRDDIKRKKWKKEKKTLFIFLVKLKLKYQVSMNDTDILKNKKLRSFSRLYSQYFYDF